MGKSRTRRVGQLVGRFLPSRASAARCCRVSAALLWLLGLAACGDDFAISDPGLADATDADSDGGVTEIPSVDVPADAAPDPAADVPAEVTAALDVADVPDVFDVLVCPDGMEPADSQGDVTTVDAAACVPVPPPCMPTPEVCNGIDDDCNGIIDDGTCSDGNPCTFGDVCSAAACLPGPATDCTDGNACTTDTCAPATGCSHVPFTGPCNDGNACTEGDSCALVDGVLACTGATKSCHDENSCTVDSCDPAKGCVHIVAPVNTACDDQNACTANDLCDHDGNCAGTPIACDDGNPCTVDQCDTKGACTFAPGNGGPCEDGDLCTVGDACVLGVCSPGLLTVCNDDNACTTDSCGSATGQCVFQPTSAPCDDGNACTVGDACAVGLCAAGTLTACNDKISCTDDACNPLTGLCVFTPVHDGLGCQDGQACTTGDVCVGGACQSGQLAVCDDGNACTLDGCSDSGACSFVPQDGTACSDGDGCTQNDACLAGQCTAGKDTCQCKKLSDCAVLEDGDLCNGTLWCDLADHSCKVDPATVVVCDTTKNSACLQYVCNKLTGQCDAHNLNDGGPCNADSSACSSGDFCQAGVCLTGNIPGCNDNNACTNDSCDPVLGCQFLANSLSCDDNDPCTLSDHCAGGACTGGLAKNCDDGTACTADSCIAGFCINKPLTGTPCSDGSLCTVNDACQIGLCVPGTPLVCPDGPGCTVPVCDGTTGACGTKSAFDGAPCEDGSKCTQGDYCLTGKCVSGYVNCTASDPCLTGACDVASGTCVFQPGPDGTACNDGNPCTVSDVCSGGKCLSGALKECPSGQICAQAACDITTGTCVANPNGIACDDNNACTGGDHCQDGACLFATVQTCDDGLPCTKDSCDPVSAACSHVNAPGPCDDGSVCTQNDSCTGGLCLGTSKLNCDDGYDCTTDVCDAKLACLHTNLPSGTPCDDHSDCTVNDQCLGQICKGTGQVCDDNNLCTENKCSLANGCSFPPKTSCDDGNPCTLNDQCISNKCVSAQVVVCNDGNPCTTDTCSGVGGCLFAPASGAACSDNNACTSGDTCMAGTCVGKVTACDDNNSCTVDECDPTKGCAYVPSTAIACSDGNACTLKDVCLNGNCVSGDALNCADGNICTDDACVPATGCVNTAAAGACDDGNFCTGPDVCDTGTCKGQGVVSCDDGQACTTDVCVATDGCLNYPVASAAACDDGNPCTKGDVCKSGSCSGVAVINCNDGNYCTLDSCSLATGCAHVVQTGSACDDGNLCTVGDVCTAAGTCKAGASGACDDGNPCTTDTCTAAAGCAHAPGSTGKSTSLAIPGDTQVTVTLADGSTQPAVATWDQFSGWTHAVSQAVWLWSSYLVQNPQADTQVAFSRTFTIPAGAATLIGQMAIASDGAFVCLLNGQLVGVNTAEQNWLAPISQPLAGKLKVGSNTLVCTLVNPGMPGSTAYTNPAGLLFRIDATMYDASGAIPCNDGNACTQGDWCNGGACQPGGILSCDDQNGCTADACDAKLGCTHTASGALACNDGNPCTAVDACVGTVCTGGTPTNCEDFNACTVDSCSPASGCVHAVTNGAACDDGNPCTLNDACVGSSCTAGMANACDDGNVCSLDGCTLLAGCFHTQVTAVTACNDNDPCTTGDSCTGVTCIGPTAANCDDGQLCTTDSCATGVGCVHTPNTLPCNDNSLCTPTDTCVGGVCVGTPKACTDNNACTADTCEIKTGFCIFVPLASGACDDGNACTTGDQCLTGVCKAGALRNCDDGDACTVDGCIPGTGACTHAPVAAGLSCDDGDPCTVTDTCSAAGCHGLPKACDDGNPCTTDTCSASSGLCLSAAVADGTTCAGGSCTGGVCK